MFMVCLLDRTIHICVSCFTAVQIWFFEVQFSHTDPWLFNMALHDKELSEDLRIRIVALHKDGLGYTKFSNSLELSYNTVVRVIEGHFQDGFHTEQASQRSIKEVESLCCASGSEAGFKNRCMSAASIALEVAEVEVSLSVLRPYTTHCIKSVCMAVVPEESLFWSWLTKKPANSLLKTTWPRAWFAGTMCCGLMSQR